jgi:hypothetical protein
VVAGEKRSRGKCSKKAEERRMSIMNSALMNSYGKRRSLLLFVFSRFTVLII